MPLVHFGMAITNALYTIMDTYHAPLLIARQYTTTGQKPSARLGNESNLADNTADMPNMIGQTVINHDCVPGCLDLSTLLNALCAWVWTLDSATSNHW